MKIFKDRRSAGKLLAQRIQGIRGNRGNQEAIVLGIPRGGVVVAAEVAKALRLPLDVLVTRKIGYPDQPELAVGAIDPDGEIVWDQENIREVGEFGDIVEKELDELRRRENLYRQGKKALNVEGKVVILVDDGIATGATTLAAINYLKRHQVKKIILATPVASKEAADRLIRELGEAMILETPENFGAVGQFYQEFEEVSDSEVVQYLKDE